MDTSGVAMSMKPVARIIGGELPKPRGADRLISLSNHAEIAGLWPIRNIVRQLRIGQDIIACSHGTISPPEGGFCQHLSQEDGI